MPDTHLSGISPDTNENNMKRVPELLSPAGDRAALEAAIEGGCDAVYFGAGSFNARMRAGNFDGTAVSEAIRLCHAYGVKSYITVNTRVRDTELTDALTLAESLCKDGADAIIIADIGLAGKVRAHCPNIELHASTQMTGCGLSDCEFLSHNGFSRMVVPRELTMEQFKAICATSPIEIEMFIHGAYCVSLSGQCLMSWAMGGRSGNRGMCAQPCRLPYSAQCGGGYPLSLRDMCLASYITEIIDTGVTSLKIEGRQKSADYVLGVTRIYRRLLDERRNATESEIAELAKLFSRDGFTDGYFTKNHKNMLGVRSLADYEGSTKNIFAGLIKKVPLEARLDTSGDTVSLTVKTPYAESTVTCDIADGITAPLDPSMAEKNMARLGSTPFTLEKFEYGTLDGLTLSMVNRMRREAADMLMSKPATAENKPVLNHEPAVRLTKYTATPTYTAEFQYSGQIPDTAKAFFDEIYLPIEYGIAEYGMTLPAYLTDDRAREVFDIAEGCGGKLLVHTLGQAYRTAGMKLPLAASIRLTVFNENTASVLDSLGAESYTPSPELPLGAVRAMRGCKSVIVYGRLPLMTTVRCAMSDGGRKCMKCGDDGGGYVCGSMRLPIDEKFRYCGSVISDRRGTNMPILGTFGCTNVIYNAFPIYMADRMSELRTLGAAHYHFIFTTEDKAEVARIIEAYKNGRAPVKSDEVRRLK